ncbi:MAG TPA: maleylpyruvate isomerase family mycothiol-dependent enzyme [Candidatus Angelobacter sp.]|jgi:uncharacterized protein (TIGR03083 family)|nr:maleylpyruvate isomerase family mycothiol-dependent enzyme [Candidatus Angelobacter sp.]
MDTLSYDDVLAALRRTQERLVAALAPLSGDQLAADSYCDDWTIAQVASHMGSASEIFGGLVEAGLSGGPVPPAESNQAIWDRWNAKAPDQQAVDAIRAAAGFIAHVEALTPEQTAAWRLRVYGAERTLAELLRMRLAEQAVHTWDIVVMADPSAALPEDATALMVDALPMMVGYAGRTAGDSAHIAVSTEQPERAFLLELTETGVRLAPGPDSATTAELRLPAEALVRLVYGRLDPEHTPPSVEAKGVELDTLRGVFRGF